jgi:predicted metal-dependent hydrolase
MNPQLTDMDIPRYTDRALPGYRHLPFQNAHPFLDKGGHSYGETLTPPEEFDAQNWQHCEEYLYCIDLFNNGFWWETHERLKFISMATSQESETNQFIRGIIQIAAALLKHFMGEEGGAQTLAKMGIETLRKKEGIFLGIDITTLTHQVEECLQSVEGKYPRIRLEI